jgi:hypothetical protein
MVQFRDIYYVFSIFQIKKKNENLFKKSNSETIDVKAIYGFRIEPY